MPFSIGLGAPHTFLYYSTCPGMSLLPNLQFERVRKRKKYFLIPDGRSNKKYCPESLAGMYKGILYLSQSNRNIVLINPLLYTGIIPLILISFSQFTLANHLYQMFNKWLEALPTLPHTQVHHSLLTFSF